MLHAVRGFAGGRGKADEVRALSLADEQGEDARQRVGLSGSGTSGDDREPVLQGGAGGLDLQVVFGGPIEERNNGICAVFR